ncbi:MAG: M48 family metalloprotease [Bacteroidota bacterium]|nr:M48 family metalloprotease [Bacteroidota bacterium]
MIIIEMGLMARLQNEGQLAYILCHEISHYKYNHIFRDFKYIKTSDSQRNFEMDKYLSFSRTLEHEADSLGFILFKKTGYAFDDAITVFDILDKSEQAIYQDRFSPFYFAHDNYIFPQTLTLDSLVIVATDSSDVASTHPLALKRKAAIIKMVPDSGKNETHFIISKESFRYLKQLVIIEMCTLYMESQNFVGTIYHAQCVANRDSSQREQMQQVIGEALYNMSILGNKVRPAYKPEICIMQVDRDGDFRSRDPEDDEDIAYDKISGESQRAYYFFQNLSPQELAILTFDWNWKIYRQNGFKDSLQGKICDNLLLLIRAYTPFDTTKIQAAFFESAYVIIKEPEKKGESLYIKLRDEKKDVHAQLHTSDPFKKQLNIAIAGNKKMFSDILPEYIYYAFEKYYEDSVFRAHFSAASTIPLPTELPHDILETSAKEKASSRGMDIHKTYFTEATYVRLREIKRTETYRYDDKNSELRQTMMNSALTTAAARAKIDIVNMDPSSMDSSRIEDYITFCMMKQWYDEFIAYQLNPMAINFAHKKLSDSLALRLGTPYLFSTNIISKHKKRIRDMFNMISLMIIPISAPIAIPYALIPRERSRCQSVLFDVRTGMPVLYYETFTKNGENTAQMCAYYSAVFQKISSKKGS